MSVNVLGRTVIGVASKLSGLNKSSICVTQYAGIVSKAIRDMDNTRPLPYPYKKKGYNLINAWFDKTTWRFDENSKIIVVDGAVATGKDDFAAELAKQLDMAYIPNANLDEYYVNHYGFDERLLNEQLPPGIRSFDVGDFLANPNDKRTTIFQNLFMQIRMSQYIDALAHVLNTGQGVVMNRSIYSDFVYVDTMLKFGYLTKNYRRYYQQNLDTILPSFMRPHLCIYLDLPVEESLKRLKERKRAGEENSPFYRPEVLAHMENLFKHKYIKDISTHAEVLTYDMTEDVDMDFVVEDVERAKLDMDDYAIHDSKFNDWRLVDEQEWNARRMSYTTFRWEIEIWMNHIPVLDCDELKHANNDFEKLQKLRIKAPGGEYDAGFNPKMGDSVWTKSKAISRWR